MTKEPKKQTKPISLNPLKFDEAVFDILKVKPESKRGKTKMPEKTVTVKCPWCKKKFDVQIDTKYKSAEAVPQDGSNLDTNEGYNKQCSNPKCEHQLFIRYIK